MSTKAKWAAGIVAAIIFVVVLIWQTGVNAGAATPKGDCTTPSEFSQLEVPMPAKEARQILDGPGQRVPGHPHQRVYQICGHPNAVDKQLYVIYSKGRFVGAVWMVSWVTGPPPGYVTPGSDEPLPPGTSVCTDPDGVVVDCDFGN